MEIQDYYKALADHRQALQQADKDGDKVAFCQLALEIEMLEAKTKGSRDWRKRVLDDHGFEWCEQDEQIFVLGSWNYETGVWVWEDVTTCNIFEWLGY